MHHLTIIYRNGRQWQQVFPDVESLVGYINTCSNIDDDNVASVFSTCDNVRVFYKG